jgi:phospholipid-binding lipoprotein MlaA
MKAFYSFLFFVTVLLLPVSPVHAVSANEYGVGAEDYIVEGKGKDLSSEDATWYGDEGQKDIRDPLESWNRVGFGINDRLYFWVLKPVKNAYTTVVPRDIRSSFGNFFSNLGSPIRLVNTLLQGRIKDSGVEFSRFAVNTFLGVFGFGDVAADSFDLKPQRADFGQTLGVYGIGEGVYLCWPLLGPSSIRDSVGLAAEYTLNAVPYSDVDFASLMTLRGVELVNRMSIVPDVYEDMKMNSLDPYVAMRQAYIDYRRALIKAGR